MAASPPLHVSSTSILTSCCIAIFASSWAAYLLGKRHGSGSGGGGSGFVVSRSSGVRDDDEFIDNDISSSDNEKDTNEGSRRKHSKRSTSTSSSSRSSLPVSDGCPASSSSATPSSPPEQQLLPPVFPIHPIGTLQSIYRLCVGTPRQGMLVPHSRGIITFDETFISQDAVLELKHYSHVYVVFVFHLNSNTHKTTDRVSSSSSSSLSSAATKSRQYPSKIAPPSLGGKKVGVFSTRTPHRPNPIGFSLCKLDKVVVSSSTTQKNNNNKKNQKQLNTTKTTFSLLLSGLDIVDGTPILDIKPYVPHYDCVGYTDNGNIDAANKSAGAVGKQFHDDDHNNNNPIVRVPQWVDSGLRKRRSIVFLHAAEQFLTNLATSSSSSSSLSSLPSLLSHLRFYGPNSPWNDASSTIAVQHIRNVIIEVLTADVRSVWQTAKARRGEFQAERSQRLSVLKSSSSTTTIPNDKKEEVGAGGTRLMVEGNDGGMIECCTQQIDNLLVHYTIAGPTTSTSTSTSAAAGTDTNGSDTMMSATDERSLGSGAEDSVVVVSISLI